MLVRSPLLTSHKWRELVPSGRLVRRCHDVFLWCYVCFVLLRFRLYAFVEAAVLRSIVLRYAGATIATRVSFSFFGYVAFSELFCTISAFSLDGEYVVRSSFRMVFFYLVTTGWIFDISLCENSIQINSIHVDALVASQADTASAHAARRAKAISAFQRSFFVCSIGITSAILMILYCTASWPFYGQRSGALRC